VVDETAYLEASGLDPDAIEEAGDRDPRQPAGSSKRAVVEDALADLEEPTEADVIAYAAERGVGAGYVRKSLEKLVRRGAVSESRGVYRLL